MEDCCTSTIKLGLADKIMDTIMDCKGPCKEKALLQMFGQEFTELEIKQCLKKCYDDTLLSCKKTDNGREYQLTSDGSRMEVCTEKQETVIDPKENKQHLAQGSRPKQNSERVHSRLLVFQSLTDESENLSTENKIWRSGVQHFAEPLRDTTNEETHLKQTPPAQMVNENFLSETFEKQQTTCRTLMPKPPSRSEKNCFQVSGDLQVETTGTITKEVSTNKRVEGKKNMLSKVLEYLGHNPDGKKAVEIAVGIGGTARSEVNPYLYKLEQIGIVQHTGEKPPIWKITREPVADELSAIAVKLVEGDAGKGKGKKTKCCQEPDGTNETCNHYHYYQYNIHIGDKNEC